MNSQAFTPEEVEQGLHIDLIRFLLDLSNKMKDSYFDIHITSDGYCTIVEWVDVSYNFPGEEDKFVLLKGDEYIMKEIRYPDNTYDLVYPEEVEEKLSEWHKQHPEWVKTSYGTWTNEEENKKWKEMLDTPKDNVVYEENGVPQK